MILVLSQNKNILIKTHVIIIGNCTIQAKATTETGRYKNIGEYPTQERCTQIMEEIVSWVDQYSMLKVYKMSEK